MPGQNANDGEKGMQSMAEERGLQAMLEEQHNVQQRIMTVETTVTQHDRRLTIVEMVQTDLQKIIGSLAVSTEKSTDLQHTLSQKTALNEQLIMAVKDRTDSFADHMETAIDRLTVKHEDVSRKVERQETKWGVVQAIGLAVMGVLIAILVQHFFHF